MTYRDGVIVNYPMVLVVSKIFDGGYALDDWVSRQISHLPLRLIPKHNRLLELDLISKIFYGGYVLDELGRRRI